MFDSLMSSEFDLKKDIIRFGQQLAEKQMVAGSDGNISARIDETQIVITPSGFAKGRLEIDDLVVVDMSGRVIKGKYQPSSEMAMHLFAYQKRPDIGACIHAHPPYATAFAVAGVKLESDILPEVVVFVGDIPLTAYAPPGTEAVPKALAPFIEKNNAFLLSNHGLLTIGRSLTEAYNRHETVEQYARIIHLARQLSPDIRHIPSADYERLVVLQRQLAAKKFEDD